jgi:SAM-dependent methyltransferase
LADRGLSAGRFDTDASALSRRIEAHRRFATRELEPWVLELVEPRPGMACLDLGCGTGKQTLALAESVGNAGTVLAVDASTEALAALERTATSEALDSRIQTLASDFDLLSRRPCERRFDRAIGCYSLYYSRDPAPLIVKLHEVLVDEGILFACGPGLGNNEELQRFRTSLGGGTAGGDPIDGPVEFMEHTAPALIAEAFGSVERFEFENPFSFDSPESLHRYWSSHNSFDPELGAAFLEAAESHFSREPRFVTVKRVIGLRARRRPSRAG